MLLFVSESGLTHKIAVKAVVAITFSSFGGISLVYINTYHIQLPVKFTHNGKPFSIVGEVIAGYESAHT